MIFMPDGDSTLRILSIDPGSDTLGASIIDVDLNTLTATVIDSITFNASLHLKHGPQYSSIEAVHGNRYARLTTHKNNLTRHMGYWKPHMIICEAPFMGLNPKSYATLVECVDAIREATYRYNPLIELYTVPPMNAKKAIGVSGRGKTKDDVRDAILNMVNNNQSKLCYTANTPLVMLDEHSIDSIAVGYYLYLELIKSI